MAALTSHNTMLPLLIIILCLVGCGGGDSSDEKSSLGGTSLNESSVISAIMGGLTTDSAKIYVTTTGGTNISINVGNQSLGYSEEDPAITFEDQGHKIHQFHLKNLLPDSCYDYYFVEPGPPTISSPIKSFCTPSQNPVSLKIGLLGDLDSRLAVPAPAISSLAVRNPDLVLIVGDWDHRNPQTFEDFVTMHLENQGLKKQSAKDFNRYFSGRIPVSYVWDDHDFGNNNSNRYSPTKADAIRAYNIFWPSYNMPNSNQGIWHNFSFGQLAEIFVLDLRSQKDFASYEDPFFIGDFSQYSNRDTLRWDSERSILDGGALPERLPKGQKEWLKNALLDSTAQWKIILSTVTWNATTEKDDAWWDFMAEREEILNFIKDNSIDGVFFVSGDIHSGGAIDSGVNAGLPEISFPSTNLNPDSTGMTTCNRHPEPDRSSPSSCGIWSEGFLEHGSGYGLITLSFDEAILETANQLGGSLRLTLGQ